MVQLHLHSMEGSLLDAVSSIKDYLIKAKAFNHPAMAVTEHGRLNSSFYHYKYSSEAGIKPIIGIEMYINNQLIYMQDDKRKRSKDNHIILLVKNDIGYQNLLYLNYLSMKDEKHFYYVPRIDFNELFQYSEGLLCGTACFNSPFSNLLKQNKYTEAESLFDNFLSVFKDNFYAEVQLNELNDERDNLSNGQKTYNDWLIDIANRKGVPIVITGDVHYAEKGMDKIQTLSIAIRDGTTIDNLGFQLESKNLYYHSLDDYLQFNKEFNYNYKEADIIKWADTTDFIASKTNFNFPVRKKAYLPKITNNDNENLIIKAKKGLISYFKVNTYEDCPKEYRERLEKELSILLKKGFASYFLLLADIMEYAKKENISRGTARGSAGGSLVAFCLDITRLDPIKYNLLFNRFLSESRCPDMVYDYWVKDT